MSKIFQLQPLSAFNPRVLAERSYRNALEVIKDVTSIAEAVKDALAMLDKFQHTITASKLSTIRSVAVPKPGRPITAATTKFVIDSDDVVKNSPKAKALTQADIKKLGSELNKNFIVVQCLFDAKRSLETLEAKVKASYNDMGPSAAQAVKAIADLRKALFAGLNKAFSFLNKEAVRSQPSEFVTLNKKLLTIASRALAYKEAKAYAYMFVADAATGDLAYANYLELNDVIDDKGNKVPKMYIITSCSISADIGKDGSPLFKGFYLDMQYEFEAPSSDLFVQAIEPTKINTVVTALADLLTVAHFANTLKRVPINLLVNPSAVKPGLMDGKNYIDRVEMNDELMQIDFVLKPTVTDKKITDDLVQQLYMDVKGLVTSTRARLRISQSTRNDSESGAKVHVISFFLVKADNSPSATPDDMAFLKNRFNLDDKAVTRALEIINKSK